ncbi:kinase-like domain-containing protein [Mycena vulgaris]|nr:kinase-like domain-containing protein [Mycena vulgaris]
MTLNNVLIHLLRHWNLEWEKECSESLSPEHVSLRLLGNVGVQPHSTHGTLGQFFDAHERVHGNHPKKILQGPTTVRLPSPSIYLEGFISITDFEKSTGVQAPYFVHTDRENRKRKTSLTNNQELTSSKRTRTQLSVPTPLRSEFAAVPGFSKMPFAFAIVSISQEGVVNIELPEISAGAVISMCLLQDAPFDQGQIKMIHKAIIDGLPWVAKRFFNIGAGEGHVDIQENYEQVVKEVTRLSKAGYFLKRFIAEAKKKGVEIEQGIQVTDFKLGVEVIQEGCGPSTASGFSSEHYLKHKTTRTLSQGPSSGSSNLDDPASTLNTFTHYAYLFSLESMVLADLQSATIVDENGEGIQVLFDVMSHTLDGSSGVGDHAIPGVNTFLQKHECGNRCRNLHLSRDGFSTESASEDSDSDN